MTPVRPPRLHPDAAYCGFCRAWTFPHDVDGTCFWCADTRRNPAKCGKPRSFDWEHAARLYAEPGASLAGVAAECGVSLGAVVYAFRTMRKEAA